MKILFYLRLSRKLTRNENCITQITFSLTKLRGVRWVGNTACMVNEKCVQNVAHSNMLIYRTVMFYLIQYNNTFTKEGLKPSQVKDL